MASVIRHEPPNDDAWLSWMPKQLDHRLAGTSVPWYVVGGWALDLWLGGVRRPHEDLEFSVAPQDAPRIAHMLPELTFFEATEGNLREVDAATPMAEGVWQWWGADLGEACWRVDLMAERGTPDRWHYKRDPSLTVPRADAIRKSADGIRYLAPELVLLFKAKHRRPKDDADFNTIAPMLNDRERAKLRGWLAISTPTTSGPRSSRTSRACRNGCPKAIVV